MVVAVLLFFSFLCLVSHILVKNVPNFLYWHLLMVIKFVTVNCRQLRLALETAPPVVAFFFGGGGNYLVLLEYSPFLLSIFHRQSFFYVLSFSNF